MLELQNITFTHRDTGRTLIKNFNFILHPGERAAIIGEEGNGKSTLLQYIWNPALVEQYCEVSGRVLTHGRKLAYLAQELPRKWNGRPASAFFQDVDDYGALYTHTDGLGAVSDLIFSDRLIDTLSGGEKLKLRMIRLLADQPDILLLDEPTNDLDLDALAWLESFLCRCTVPVLYVSHDETLLEKTANVVIHLEQVRRKTVPRHTVLRIGYSDYVQQRTSLMEKQEQVARKQQSEYENKVERWQQLYNKVNHQQNTISRADPHGGRLLKKSMRHLLSQKKSLDRESDQYQEIPDTEDAVSFQFPEARLPAGKKILDFHLSSLQVGEGNDARILAENIDLVVRGGERVAITGKNGGGKTTLLRRIWAELSQRRDIQAGLMPQNYAEAMDFSKMPVEILSPDGSKAGQTRARTFLGSMKYTPEEMLAPCGALSGGQKGKLLLLRLILEERNVLVLDEPTRNLSPLSNPIVRKALGEYGGTIIAVTHDRYFLQEVCTAAYRLQQDGLHPLILSDRT